MQPLTLNLKPGTRPGSVMLELTTNLEVIQQILTVLFPALSPLTQASTKGKARTPAAASSRSGHRLLPDLICQWCSNLFAGRAGQKYCSKVCTLKAQRLARQQRNGTAATAEAA